MILVTWLCFSGEKGERMWSHSSAWFNNGVFAVNSKRRTLIRGKSIHESFRGRILASIIAECKRKLSIEVFGASTKMVDSETPKCEQEAVPAKSARRKECDHVRSLLFDLTNKATWPKSLMFGATIYCHSCLWIRGLPVSVVTQKIQGIFRSQPSSPPRIVDNNNLQTPF